MSPSVRSVSRPRAVLNSQSLGPTHRASPRPLQLLAPRSRRSLLEDDPPLSLSRMIAFRRSLFDQCDHPCRSFRRCESCTKNPITPLNDVRRDRHSQDGKLNFSCHTANEFAERVQKFGASPELEIHKYRISKLCLTFGTSERFDFLTTNWNTTMFSTFSGFT